MRTIKRYALLLFTTIFMFSCSEDTSLDPNPILIIQIDGRDIHYISLLNLKNNLTSQDISIFDPVHGKQKNYRAFLLADILEYAYGSDALTINPMNRTIKFTAYDGFSASATLSRAIEAGGYLAFHDLDVTGAANWEAVAPENNNDPAPYYVVWSGQNQNPTTNGYPWPYQLSHINLIN